MSQPVPEAARLRSLLVVPHTHWDREWYRPFEAYRHRLLKTLDRVLASELPYFLLDGQTVVVEDYLALRPEMAETLRLKIAAGKLGFGPWYVLVDEFLVSGEALVRNLLEGRRAMREFGAHEACGYLPDMFGHIAQMPQILRGFGLTGAVVWRGANPSSPRFRWRGPDGSSVTTAWLPLGYYQTMFMDEGTTATRQGQVATYLAAFEGQDSAWLLSGADHMAPRTDLVTQLAALNEELIGWQARLGTLSDVLAGPAPEVELVGELRDPTKAYILPGVLSARIYLKQANAHCQRLLERYVEPLTALAWWEGANYPAASVRHVWKELMKNHPHDSICGCSIDQVHREMMPRFAAVEQVGAELLADAVSLRNSPVADPPLYAFNPTGWAWSGWLELVVDWPRPREKDTESAAPPNALELVTAEGQAVPLIALGHEDTEVFCAEIDLNPDWFPVRRFRVAVKVDIPALGGLRLVAHAAPDASANPAVVTPEVAAAVTADANMLENEWLRLRVNGGQVRLEDKQTGVVHPACHGFRDEGDAGDEYNFSPLAGDEPLVAVGESSRLVESSAHAATLEVTYRLSLPIALSPDRQTRGSEHREATLVSRFSLRAGERRVTVETRVDNQVLDHRLRLVVAFDQPERPSIWSDDVYGAFARVPAEMSLLPVAKGTEATMPEFPQGAFTALQGTACGLAVAVDGLPEASLISTETGWGLAVTLLRSVGWLSRDDLRTRGGGAGPRLPTPEAQCLGEQVFRYALIPYTGTWPLASALVHGEAHQFLSPPMTWTATGLMQYGSAVSMGDPRPVLSALKRSEDGHSLIVRFYNPGPNEVMTEISVNVPHDEIHEADLNEEPGRRFHPVERTVTFRPYEAKTWRISRKI